MKIIELHILQSFPPTCLNRDRFGAPKFAMFGGVERARVSSQAWKRPTRELFQESEKGFSETVRTKYLLSLFTRIIKSEDTLKTEEEAESIAKKILSVANGDKKLFGKLDTKKNVVDTLFYISEQTATSIVRHVLKRLKEDSKYTPKFKEVSDLLKEQVSDAADIALFGRMVAADTTNTIEGAAMFSHALSTHAVRSELDFFSAVDDEKKVSDDSDDAGAGHMGEVEYNSACYYRYIGINLNLLDPAKSKNNCNLFDPDQKRVILETFIKAAIQAIPQARKNSMFGQGLPSYVLAVKRSGQPLSLANAFENPVKSDRGGGYIAPSVERLESEWKMMEETFGIKADVLCKLDPKKIGAADNIKALPIDKLIEELVNGIA